MRRVHVQVAAGVLLSAFLLFVLVRIIDLAALRAALASADWRVLWLAPVFVGLYYLAIGERFALFAHLAGIEVPKRGLALLAAVSTAINRTVGFAGVAGYSLRLHYVTQRGGRASAVLAASLLNHTFKVVLMTIGLPLVLVAMLVAAGEGGLPELTATLVLAAALTLGVIGAAQLFVRPRPVHVALPGTSLMARVKRSWAGERVARMRDVLGSSVTTLVREPQRLVLPAALVAAEVAASMAVLLVCFLALGEVLVPIVLVAGYAIGFVSRFVSVAPGGLGLQEASMAGGFALMGVGFEVAVVAVLLFRALMDWLPCIVALFVARRLVAGAPLFKPVVRDGVASGSGP